MASAVLPPVESVGHGGAGMTRVPLVFNKCRQFRGRWTLRALRYRTATSMASDGAAHTSGSRTAQ